MYPLKLIFWLSLFQRAESSPSSNAPIIGHPLGGGAPGKGGDFVKDPVKVLIFPLLGGDTEESKFPSLRGITLSSLKPDKKTVLYTLNEMSCFNSAYMFVTMQIYNTCAIRRGRHRKHEEKGGPRFSAQRSSCLFI